jgi:hypothetical protein
MPRKDFCLVVLRFVFVCVLFCVVAAALDVRAACLLGAAAATNPYRPTMFVRDSPFTTVAKLMFLASKMPLQKC